MRANPAFSYSSKALLIVILALFSAVSVADTSIAERIATHKLLRESVEQGQGKYARIGTQDKARLIEEQDRIFALLQGKSTASDLSSAEKAQLDMAESTVAQIVVKLDPPVGENKLVCSYKAPIGSKRKERVCERIDSTELRARLAARPTYQEGNTQ